MTKQERDSLRRTIESATDAPVQEGLELRTRKGQLVARFERAEDANLYLARQQILALLDAYDGLEKVIVRAYRYVNEALIYSYGDDVIQLEREMRERLGLPQDEEDKA